MADEVKAESKVEVPKEIAEFQQKNSRFAVHTPAPVNSEPVEQTPVKEHTEKPQEPSQKAEADKQPDSSKEDKETEEAKKPVDWEKRYKDIQREYTKATTKLKKAGKFIEQAKSKFAPVLKLDEDGDPEDFDFSQVQNQQQTANVPIPPTDEEWEDAQFDAKKQRILVQKQSEFDRYVLKRELAEEKENERQQALMSNRDQVTMKIWNESLKQAQDEYPDFANNESEFFKTCEDIVESEKKLGFDILQHPKGNLLVAREAAAKLGILPKSKQQVTEKQVKTQTQEPSKLMGAVRGAGQAQIKSAEKVPENIQKFMDSQAKYKLRQPLFA